MITEMDMDVLPLANRSGSADPSLRLAARPELNPYTNSLPQSVQQQMAKRYADLFSVLVKHRTDISRVTFWGVTDGDSWLNNWPVHGPHRASTALRPAWQPQTCLLGCHWHRALQLKTMRPCRLTQIKVQRLSQVLFPFLIYLISILPRTRH